MNRFLIKINRLAAWVLMAVIILYAVSGYGMTKGLIDQNFARTLHLSWLGGIGIAAFIIHTFYGLSLAFRRRQIWNKYSRIALIAFYVLLAGFFLYVHFFYAASYDDRLLSRNEQKIEALTNADLAAPSGVITSAQTENKRPVFTAATLAADNGLNGRPAYVAVDGIVYDLSSVFRNGQHQGHQAGQDLSALFYSQHSSSILKYYPVVGTYQP